MTAIGGLLKHFFSYFTGRLAVLAAGLISLPVMTRLLTREDYGVMSLVFLTLTIASALSAMGFPQSTTRYFAEYAKHGRRRLTRFCSTMMLGALASGTAASALLYFVSLGLLKTDSFAGMAVHLRYAAILVVIRVLTAITLQIFRSSQRSGAYNLLQIVNRYLTIGTTIVFILAVFHDVRAVFIATILVESLVLLVALYFLNRRQFVAWIVPKTSFLTRAIRFGAPLIIADVMVTLVASSDRFAIQYFLGPEQVAAYSVAYDVSDYVAIMFSSPLQLAILPIVYSLWADEGEQATREFLEKAVNLSLVLIIAIIAGLGVVGPDLVTVLASEKYADSARLIPYVAFGVVLGSVNFLMFTGLLIREKTVVITYLNMGAALVNITLNMILIPRIGLLGAAYSSILTYISLNVTMHLVSSRFLYFRLHAPLLLKAMFVAGGMAFVVAQLGGLTGSRILDVAIQIPTGAAIYLGAMYIFDSTVRSSISDGLGRSGESA